MLTLCENSRTRDSVWHDTSCTEPERFAAEELTRFLVQITGANFACLYGDKMPEEAIVVGSPDALEALGIHMETENLGEEGYILRTVGPKIVIAGGRPRGVLYGVYAFLEKVCGCRWFTPAVSRIPKRYDLTVESLDVRETPALEYREPFFRGNALEGAWAARNRCNGHMAHLYAHQGGQISYYPFVHSFASLLSPDEYFDEHPEYFSMVDGVRVREHTQLCLTNENVIAIAVERVKTWVRTHPEATIFSVSQNDWYNPCTCPECAKLDREQGSHAGSLIAFVNRVAEEVEKEYPRVIIDTLAYQYTRTPPKTMRPRKNVCVRLCSIECCFAHPLDKCEKLMSFGNRIHGDSFQKDLEGWAQVCDRLYVWDYVVNFHHFLMPFPNFGVLAENLRYFVRNHVRGVFEEGSTSSWGKTEFIEMKSWVLAKLLWNPDQDAMALAEEFIRGYYGNAAPQVLAYFHLLHDRLAACPDAHFGIYDPPRCEYLRPEDIREALSLFARGKEAAEDPDVRERVAICELPIRYWALMKMPESQQRQAEISRFHEDLLCRNIRQITEGRSLDESIRRLREGLTYQFSE